MLMSLLFSGVLLLRGVYGYGIAEQTRHLVERLDFQSLLLEGVLVFLLFAGALHIDLNDLAEQKWEVGLPATFGVLLSTAIIGGLMYFVSNALRLNLSLLHCFLFGALISPTDPIAVLAILKNLPAPRSLKTKLAGESLFNDGVAVVVFIALLSALDGKPPPTLSSLSLLFLEEAVGGVALGFLPGVLSYLLLRSIDNHQVEILITLALVGGGYCLAARLHLSGPIAMVIAGLLIGNHGRRFAMSENTRENLDNFWELVDSILNALLLVLFSPKPFKSGGTIKLVRKPHLRLQSISPCFDLREPALSFGIDSFVYLPGCPGFQADLDTQHRFSGDLHEPVRARVFRQDHYASCDKHQHDRQKGCYF